jgi:EAL domain-containing protein (putative c-di-GMP-specific phosphodiesterase class I)
LPEQATAPVDDLGWSGLLAAAIDGERVAAAFQPIVDLQRGVITGYEALARFTDGPQVSPDQWFAEAARRGCVAELEAAVLRVALSYRADLPPNAFMSVNVEPESLLDPFVMRLLGAHAPLDGLVVEVTEHRPFVDRARTVVAMEHLRDLGALIAVDDTGAGYAGLQQVLTMRPQILKLDRALVEASMPTRPRPR